MRVGLRMLKPATVRWLRQALELGQLSRAALARELCARDQWNNARGKPCAASARKALPQLAAQLGLALPAAGNAVPACRPRTPAAVAPVAFEGSLEALGPVRLELARTPRQRRLCADLLRAGHELGPGRAPGCRLTYSIESRLGPLGVLSFVAAPLRLGPRDKHLGWTPRARMAHIGQVLCNDRLLLRASVRVPNLASHVLGQARQRLAKDWRREHGVPPLLAETCVQASRPGTCYRAAGWKCVGITRGKPPGAGPPVEPKSVWLRGLKDGWEEALRAEPARELGAFPELELAQGVDWSEREFARSDLPDGRLRRRLLRIGAAWERQPGDPLTAIFPGRAAQQAAYRFLHNGHVRAEDILQPHREALLERCQQEALVLVVQDTTTLNYTGLAGSAAGLGPLQDSASRARGLFVHATVAFTEGGRPLGVSGLETWARKEREEEQGQDRQDRKGKGKKGKKKKDKGNQRKKKRKKKEEQEKESWRWDRGMQQGQELGGLSAGTRMVVVGDSESDIYRLFQAQAAQPGQAGLLVRANAGRQRKVQVDCPLLGAEMIRAIEAQLDFVEPVVTGRKVEIDSQGGQRARERRTATTEVRIGRVQLQPPQGQAGAGPLPVVLVRVLEPEAPPGETPLEWLLVSTEGEPTAAWAERIVGWYETRWRIEEFFRLLKSGTRIQDRRLRRAEALEKCLVLDAITAWRVFCLDRYARDRPETPAEEVLTADEMEVIEAVVRTERLRPPSERGQPIGRDIRTWVILLARMTGWWPSKRRPLPGNEVLWRAYVQLQHMVRLRRALRPP